MSLETQLEFDFGETLKEHNTKSLVQGQEYYDILKNEPEYQNITFTEFFINHYLPLFHGQNDYQTQNR